MAEVPSDAYALAATDMGTPVYERLGFSTRSEILTLRATEATLPRMVPHHRAPDGSDLKRMGRLDAAAVGWPRYHLVTALSQLCDAIVVGDGGPRGFAAVGEDGATAWNFLMQDRTGAVVDLHVIVLDEDGNGVLGPAQSGNAYPAASLTGRGTVAGRPVDCTTAQWAVKFRDAYIGDADDRADVLALCRRFHLPMPAQYHG